MLNIKWLFTVSIVSMIVGCNMHAMDDVYMAQCAADYKEHVRLQAKHASYYSKKEVCPQIKTLLDSASKQNFDQVIDAMRAKNLTTCDCIKFLSKEKNEKVLKATQRVFDLNTKDIENFKQQVKSEHKKAKPIEFQFKGFVFPRIQNFIKDIAQLLNAKSSVSVEVRAKASNMSAHQDFCVKSLANEQGDEAIVLNLNGLPSKATIAHELTHINKNHTLQERLIGLKTGGYVVPSFLRAQEAEADRIPAACTDCEIAKSFVEQLKSDLNDGRVDLNDEIHPKPEKRLQWAQTIHTLRTLEEKLKKST